MKRRGFITLLGGAAASWPLAARAQQPARPAKIGVLYPGLASILPSRVTALRDGLQRLGYREPDNFELILRSADGDPTRIIPLAMELVERKVDVILAVSAPAVTAARSATTTTPIVAFDLESDPIGSGLINNFSRPGGQVTGIFFDFPEFSKKWLELLKEAMPQLSSVAVLWDPATGPMQRNGVEIAGKELNVKLEILEVSGLADLDDAILAASGKGVDAILMLSSPVFGTNPERVAGLTVGVRLPAVTLFPDFARAGGLMAYGVNPINIFRQGAPIVAKVLRGSKPVFHRGFLGCSIARVDKHSHAGGSGYQLAQELQPVNAAGRAMGLQIQIVNAGNSREIDAAFATLGRKRPDALFVGLDPSFNNRRKQLALQAMRHGLPAAYASREYAEAGGLMSYGTDFLDTYRQVGTYVGRILRGAKPADLPVVQSVKFELVINQMTARILGLEVPPTLLARADEVIE
jgi:putative tryptophan/tyrosine transport system substrate-binding protein